MKEAGALGAFSCICTSLDLSFLSPSASWVQQKNTRLSTPGENLDESRERELRLNYRNAGSDFIKISNSKTT